MTSMVSDRLHYVRDNNQMKPHLQLNSIVTFFTTEHDQKDLAMRTLLQA